MGLLEARAGITQLPLCRPEKAQLKRHAAIENSKIGNWDKRPWNFPFYLMTKPADGPLILKFLNRCAP